MVMMMMMMTTKMMTLLSAAAAVAATAFALPHCLRRDLDRAGDRGEEDWGFLGAVTGHLLHAAHRLGG
eukprot:3961396-Prymnesium_polylepis.1